jgi:hypothetical protein
MPSKDFAGRIDVSGNIGTAFVCHQSTILVTASHLLTETSLESSIQWRPFSATESREITPKHIYRGERHNDVAVLLFDSPLIGHESIASDCHPPATGMQFKFRSMFTYDEGGVDTLCKDAGEGHIVNSSSKLIPDGWKVRSEDLSPGCSGAPVCSGPVGSVIGMLVGRYYPGTQGDHQDVGWMVGGDTIRRSIEKALQDFAISGADLTDVLRSQTPNIGNRSPACFHLNP